MDAADAAYLAMINNPTINPAPQSAAGDQDSAQSTMLPEQPNDFSALTTLRLDVEESCKNLVLISETDAPLEWFSAAWDSDNLPTVHQAAKWVGGDEENAKIKTLDDFFGPLTDDKDPYGQAAGFKTLKNILIKTFGANCQVYLFGESSITVLILGLLKEGENRAIAGLKSLLVET